MQNNSDVHCSRVHRIFVHCSEAPNFPSLKFGVGHGCVTFKGRTFNGLTPELFTWGKKTRRQNAGTGDVRMGAIVLRLKLVLQLHRQGQERFAAALFRFQVLPRFVLYMGMRVSRCPLLGEYSSNDLFHHQGNKSWCATLIACSSFGVKSTYYCNPVVLKMQMIGFLFEIGIGL